jgi:hypothetical protein
MLILKITSLFGPVDLLFIVGRDRLFLQSATEDEPQEVGRISCPGVAQASVQPEEDGGHRLQDETELPGAREAPRSFL